MNKSTFILVFAVLSATSLEARAAEVYAYDLVPVEAKVSTNIRGFIGEVTNEKYITYKLSGEIFDKKIIPLESLDNLKSLPKNWNSNALHVLAFYIRACQVDNDVVRMLVSHPNCVSESRFARSEGHKIALKELYTDVTHLQIRLLLDDGTHFHAIYKLVKASGDVDGNYYMTSMEKIDFLTFIACSPIENPAPLNIVFSLISETEVEFISENTKVLVR